MPSARLPPVGFWSYTRQDDALSRRQLSALKALIEEELQVQLGEKVRIFLDVSAISHGARWEEETKRALDHSSFFIPILTPSFLRSAWCCREVRMFLERQRELFATHEGLARASLIFPIHYIDVTEADADEEEVRQALLELQWFDFREMRHLGTDPPEVRRSVSEFATSVCRRLRMRLDAPAAAEPEPPPAPPPSPPPPPAPPPPAPPSPVETVAASDMDERSPTVPDEDRSSPDPGAGRFARLLSAPRRHPWAAVAIGLAALGVLAFNLIDFRSERPNIPARYDPGPEATAPDAGATDPPAARGIDTAVFGDASALISPGTYQCGMTGYRLRPCTVTRPPSGPLILDAPNGLLAIRGELGADGRRLVFRGGLSGSSPYICRGIQFGVEACRNQSIAIDLDKDGDIWVGRFTVSNFMNSYSGSPAPGRTATGYTIEARELELRIAPR